MTGEKAFWFAVMNGKQRGPLTKAQILEYLLKGRLAGNDLMWRPGFNDWKAVNDIADFWEPPSQIPGRAAAHSLISEQLSNTTDVIEKWSLWKSANFGVLLSAGLLALGAAGRGFEMADYVQTAKAQTIVSLFGVIMAAPLVFVLVALTRNISKGPQRVSSANARVSALTFVLLLCAIAGGLKLYAYYVFSSTDRISGDARSKFVERIQKSCFQNQRSLAGNEKIADVQIAKFCDCVGEKLGDNTSYRETRIEMLDPTAIHNLKQRAVVTGKACLKNVQN
jgi:hypothetical protein